MFQKAASLALFYQVPHPGPTSRIRGIRRVNQSGSHYLHVRPDVREYCSVISVSSGERSAAGTLLTSWVYEKTFSWPFLATECDFRALSPTILNISPNFVVLNFRDLYKVISQRY